MIKINEWVSVECESVGTRTGFKHVANVIVKGEKVESVKVCYSNRTWERFQFETLLKNLVAKTKVLDSNEIVVIKNYINER